MTFVKSCGQHLTKDHEEFGQGSFEPPVIDRVPFAPMNLVTTKLIVIVYCPSGIFWDESFPIARTVSAEELTKAISFIEVNVAQKGFLDGWFTRDLPNFSKSPLPARDIPK